MHDCLFGRQRFYIFPPGLVKCACETNLYNLHMPYYADSLFEL